MDKVLLQDATDIRRLSRRLLTQWEIPCVEVSTRNFPKLTAQHAQDRYRRLSEACNCLLGETLGGTTFLAGTCRLWILGGTWLDLGLVLLASLWAVMIGKSVEFAWTRVRLMLLLRSLRRRRDAPEDFAIASATRYARNEASLRTDRDSSRDIARKPATAQLRLPHGAGRPLLVLRSGTDISRAFVHLVTHWKLPRITVSIEGLPVRDTQRAQHRFMRLADGGRYLVPALLGSTVFLVGLFYEVWTQVSEWVTSKRPDFWLLGLDWSDVAWVPVAAPAAALLGWLLEQIWIRARILWLLHSLRLQSQDLF